MRTTSDDFRTAAFAPETGEVLISLLTIEHEDLAEPLRLCNNSANLWSRGELYLALPFTLTLPDDSEENPPEARITLDNISRELVAVIRSITTAPMVTLELVRSGDLDQVEAYYTDFQMRRITYEALTLQADLFLENLDREPWPSGRYIPAMFRGLF